MTLWGIRVELEANWTLTDGSPRFGKGELQRTLASTSSGTAPSTTWTTIRGQIFDGGTIGSVDDILPNDGVRRFYRVRQRAIGVLASTWLGVVDATPVELPDGDPLLW